MACRLSKEKARAIAAEYYTNGFKKVEALLSVGYSDSYANNVGLKLFDHDLVVAAMRRLSAVAIVQTGYTLDQCQNEYEQLRLTAIGKGHYATAATCITGKARLHGMDKDAQARPDHPDSLSEQELAKLRAMAKAATALKVDGVGAPSVAERKVKAAEQALTSNEGHSLPDGFDKARLKIG